MCDAARRCCDLCARGSAPASVSVEVVVELVHIEHEGAQVLLLRERLHRRALVELDQLALRWGGGGGLGSEQAHARTAGPLGGEMRAGGVAARVVRRCSSGRQRRRRRRRLARSSESAGLQR